MNIISNCYASTEYIDPALFRTNEDGGSSAWDRSPWAFMELFSGDLTASGLYFEDNHIMYLDKYSVAVIDMSNHFNFPAFDFADIWTTDPEVLDGYPVFKFMLPGPEPYLPMDPPELFIATEYGLDDTDPHSYRSLRAGAWAVKWGPTESPLVNIRIYKNLYETPEPTEENPEPTPILVGDELVVGLFRVPAQAGVHPVYNYYIDKWEYKLEDAAWKDVTKHLYELNLEGGTELKATVQPITVTKELKFYGEYAYIETTEREDGPESDFSNVLTLDYGEIAYDQIKLLTPAPTAANPWVWYAVTGIDFIRGNAPGTGYLPRKIHARIKSFLDGTEVGVYSTEDLIPTVAVYKAMPAFVGGIDDPERYPFDSSNGINLPTDMKRTIVYIGAPVYSGGLGKLETILEIKGA